MGGLLGTRSAYVTHATSGRASLVSQYGARCQWLKDEKFIKDLEGDSVDTDILDEELQLLQEKEPRTCRGKTVKVLETSPIQIAMCVLILVDAGIVIAEILLDLHAIRSQQRVATSDLFQAMDFLREQYPDELSGYNGEDIRYMLERVRRTINNRTSSFTAPTTPTGSAATSRSKRHITTVARHLQNTDLRTREHGQTSRIELNNLTAPNVALFERRLRHLLQDILDGFVVLQVMLKPNSSNLTVNVTASDTITSRKIAMNSKTAASYKVAATDTTTTRERKVWRKENHCPSILKWLVDNYTWHLRAAESSTLRRVTNETFRIMRNCSVSTDQTVSDVMLTNPVQKNEFKGRTMESHNSRVKRGVNDPLKYDDVIDSDGTLRYSRYYTEENYYAERLLKIAHALHYCSITILGVFVIQVFMKIFGMGPEFFRSKMEVFDGIIIMASFTLDLVFVEGVTGAQGEEAIALIIIFLLWRILRVINGIMVTNKQRQEFRIRLQKRAVRKVEKKVECLDDELSWHEKEIHNLKQLCRRCGLCDEEIAHCRPCRRQIQQKVNTSVGLSSIASLSLGFTMSMRQVAGASHVGGSNDALSRSPPIGPGSGGVLGVSPPSSSSTSSVQLSTTVPTVHSPFSGDAVARSRFARKVGGVPGTGGGGLRWGGGIGAGTARFFDRCASSSPRLSSSHSMERISEEAKSTRRGLLKLGVGDTELRAIPASASTQSFSSDFSPPPISDQISSDSLDRAIDRYPHSLSPPPPPPQAPTKELPSPPSANPMYFSAPEKESTAAVSSCMDKNSTSNSPPLLSQGDSAKGDYFNNTSAAAAAAISIVISDVGCNSVGVDFDDLRSKITTSQVTFDVTAMEEQTADERTDVHAYNKVDLDSQKADDAGILLNTKADVRRAVDPGFNQTFCDAKKVFESGSACDDDIADPDTQARTSVQQNNIISEKKSTEKRSRNQVTMLLGPDDSSCDRFQLDAEGPWSSKVVIRPPAARKSTDYVDSQPPGALTSANITAANIVSAIGVKSTESGECDPIKFPSTSSPNMMSRSCATSTNNKARECVRFANSNHAIEATVVNNNRRAVNRDIDNMDTIDSIQYIEDGQGCDSSAQTEDNNVVHNMTSITRIQLTQDDGLLISDDVTVVEPQTSNNVSRRDAEAVGDRQNRAVEPVGRWWSPSSWFVRRQRGQPQSELDSKLSPGESFLSETDRKRGTSPAEERSRSGIEGWRSSSVARLFSRKKVKCDKKF